MYCRKPLPAPHAKTRRYCSASCRTLAYNVRASQRSAAQSGAAHPELPVWHDDPRGQLPVLSHARQTLESVAGTLNGLARHFEAEELTLRRTLDQVLTQATRQEQQRQDLAQLRQQLDERNAELHQLRDVARERDALQRELENAQQLLGGSRGSAGPACSVAPAGITGDAAR